MINQLDEMLRVLLDHGLNEPPADWPIDVAVGPPDDAWRGAVNANGRPAVNVYLVEVREACEQRTTAALGRPRPAPFRVDCHYLLSAWIPTADPNFATPTVVEDWLLGESIRVVADAMPLNAAEILGAPLPVDVDPALEDLELPTELLPPDGYANLADFWTGLGQGNTWHPAAHVVVTLPITRQERAMPPSVRTVHLVASPTLGSVWAADGAFTIGGAVRAAATGDAVVDASVLLLDEAAGRTLATTVCDPDGPYTFGSLREGRYQLTARTATAASGLRTVAVPGTAHHDIDIP